MPLHTCSMTFARLVMLSCLTLCALGARAGNLEFPLHVPLQPIRDALRTQISATADKPEVIY